MVDVVARIRQMQFTPVRVREGYDMSEVDTFLASLGGPSASSPVAPSPRPTSDSVIQEQPGLLSRIFRSP